MASSHQPIAVNHRAGAANEGEAVLLSGVSHEFIRGNQARLVLSDIELHVDPGEFLAIVGPSGCGKSTVLNLVAGLAKPSRGKIEIGGRDVGIHARLGYVTQADGLLPWRSARANIDLPLEIRGVGQRERRERTEAALRQVGLEAYGDYYPSQLSGGMRKRVTLARALVADPTILLMDEPFSALDAQLKLALCTELLELWRHPPRTVIYVTHDLVEAISLADRVVVMGKDPGRIVAVEEIDIPRPRDLARVRFRDEFATVHDRLWGLLETAPAVEEG